MCNCEGFVEVRREGGGVGCLPVNFASTLNHFLCVFHICTLRLLQTWWSVHNVFTIAHVLLPWSLFFSILRSPLPQAQNRNCIVLFWYHSRKVLTTDYWPTNPFFCKYHIYQNILLKTVSVNHFYFVFFTVRSCQIKRSLVEIVKVWFFFIIPLYHPAVQFYRKSIGDLGSISWNSR